MNCPKCEDGTIDRVVFKKNGEIAYVCDLCEAMWFREEDVGIASGHTLSSFSEDQDLGYTIDKSFEKDQEHEPIRNIPKI